MLFRSEGLEGTAEHAETVLQEALVEPVDRVTMSDELQRAFEICERSKQAVMTMFSAVRMGQAIEMHGAAQIVEEMNQSILRHPSALLSLVRLKKADEYTYMHSVAVCALMIALARQLELTAEQVQKAGVAGLMHDVGKMMIEEIGRAHV